MVITRQDSMASHEAYTSLFYDFIYAPLFLSYVTSYYCRIFLAGYLLWSLDLPKKGFCTSVPIGTCVFILSPDHNIINIPSSYKKFYCKTQEIKVIPPGGAGVR